MAGLRVVVAGINYAPEPTGIAPYTARMAVGLCERGHSVKVVTTYPHYPEWRVPPDYTGWTRREVVDGVSVTRMRHYVPDRPQGVRRLASEVSFGARLMAASTKGADVVLLPSPALISSAMLLERLRLSRHAPAVGVIVQDLYSAGMREVQGRENALVRAFSKLESRTMRRADRVAVIHERYEHRVVTDLGVDASRVEVIRNWTHVSPAPVFDRASFRRGMGWSDDEFVVLHTGAMGEKQGLGNVVEAARLADQQAAPVRFVCMGDGGKQRELATAGADVSRLQMSPPLDEEDYVKALSAADLLLVNERPGMLETGVPSKLTSYFSSGVAVLAASEPQSVTAEELAASGAGVRVAPGDPAGLLEAVLALRADPAGRAELGARGPRYATSVLAEETSLDAYDEFVRRLADRGRRKEST